MTVSGCDEDLARRGIGIRTKARTLEEGAA